MAQNAQIVHHDELSRGHCWIGKNREGTLSVFLTTYIFCIHIIHYKNED